MHRRADMKAYGMKTLHVSLISFNGRRKFEMSHCAIACGCFLVHLYFFYLAQSASALNICRVIGCFQKRHWLLLLLLLLLSVAAKIPTVPPMVVLCRLCVSVKNAARKKYKNKCSCSTTTTEWRSG